MAPSFDVWCWSLFFGQAARAVGSLLSVCLKLAAERQTSLFSSWRLNGHWDVRRCPFDKGIVVGAAPESISFRFLGLVNPNTWCGQSKCLCVFCGIQTRETDIYYMAVLLPGGCSGGSINCSVTSQGWRERNKRIVGLSPERLTYNSLKRPFSHPSRLFYLLHGQGEHRYCAAPRLLALHITAGSWQVTFDTTRTPWH